MCSLRFILSLCLACLSAKALPSTNEATPVKLSVYYETLCSDSQHFVITQMYPVWEELKDIMEMDINVYGKATEEPEGAGFTFECQHGSEECKGNMMLTCAKKFLTEEEYLTFSNCVMKDMLGTAAEASCAQELHIDYTPIHECWNSIEGQIMLHEVGQKQSLLDPQLDYVPWILINDIYTEEQRLAAESDLKTVICNAYEGDKPATCN